MEYRPIEIDAQTVGMAVAEQFPQFRDLPVTRLASLGTVNAVFRVGPEMSARFALEPADPVNLEGEMRREAAAMAEFADHCRFAAPVPVGIGAPGRYFPLPWILQTWVEGETATPDAFAHSVRLAEDVVLLIKQLRSVDTAGRTFAGEGRGGIIADHDGWMETCFAESEGLLDVPKLRRLWSRFRTLPPAPRETMNHGDLIPFNLLVGHGRLVGVIDSGGFGPADPALDVVSAWHMFDRTQREWIFSALDCSALEQARSAAWDFQQAMGLVWYYRTRNPAMSDLGRSTLKRLLMDAGSY